MRRWADPFNLHAKVYSGPPCCTPILKTCNCHEYRPSVDGSDFGGPHRCEATGRGCAEAASAPWMVLLSRARHSAFALDCIWPSFGLLFPCLITPTPHRLAARTSTCCRRIPDAMRYTQNVNSLQHLHDALNGELCHFVILSKVTSNIPILRHASSPPRESLPLFAKKLSICAAKLVS
ncbi:hypothetical protein BDV95DRAFT_191526 [Massariosphaeria phaeospora]|uniref:Uncharacterized protein n=1 Tax=Massariosphaeria phaeospora TaxID=100035 RepID=A0A7C8I1Q1_9PLEO|nr:hypothetical protein BDV95DRAFT_191526 [Massariosphaeria phaeospora]